ncbi:MAG TPA: hypothetical protein DF614_06560, partial [Methylococcaceae bacterium]|nr:hypothetical protein [Methylococcaceae bacterium]
ATTVIGGVGADMLTLQGAVNTLTVSDSDGLSITGGAGIDTITFSTLAIATVDSGTGADKLTLGNFANILTLSDSDGISVTGGTNIDTIIFSTVVTATTIIGGTG